jgi:hypothetical protein
MPSAASFASNPTIKMLLIGHSKSRKTSSLSSLLKANYRILVADFDNNLDFLIQDLAKNAPSLLKNLLYVPLRDSTRIDRNSNVIPVGTPHAFEDFQMLLDEGMEPNPAWAKASKEDRPKIPRYIPLINPDTEEPIGPVPNLGTSWIFVIDSLWAAGRAAFLQHGKMQPSNDPRKTYYGAGQMLLSFLDAIKDPAFTPHVIVISHMTPVELANGASKFFPSSIGKANAVDVPKLFPRLLVAERRGQGKNAKYVISTTSTDDIDAGSALPTGAIAETLPQETALAEYFVACGATPSKGAK